MACKISVNYSVMIANNLFNPFNKAIEISCVWLLRPIFHFVIAQIRSQINILTVHHISRNQKKVLYFYCYSSRKGYDWYTRQ